MEKNYGTDNMSVGSSDKRKGNGFKIGILVVVLAIVLVGGVSLAASGLFKNDKAIVTTAVTKMFNSKEETPFEKALGFNKISEAMLANAYEQGLSLRFEDSSVADIASLKGFEINGDFKSDMKSKSMSSKMDVKYSGLSFADINIFLNQEKIMASVPTYSEKVFKVDYANDLKGQIKNSPMFGDYIDVEEASTKELLDMIDNYKQSMDKDPKQVDFGAMINSYAKITTALDSIKNNMTVNKIDAKDFEINKKSQSCKGYELVLTKDSVIELIDAFRDFSINDEDLDDIFWSAMEPYMSNYAAYGYSNVDDMKKEFNDSFNEVIEQLKTSLSDVTVTIYLTKDGDIANMVMSANVDTAEVVMDLTYLGGNTMSENMKGSVVITESGEEVRVDFNKTGGNADDKITSTFDMAVSASGTNAVTMTYNGEYNTKDGAYTLDFDFKDATNSTGNFNFSSKGSITNVEAGKSFTINADSLVFDVDGDTFAFSGSYSAQPYTGEITEPEGTVLDVFAATEADWTEVYTEVITKVGPLMEQFGLPLY